MIYVKEIKVSGFRSLDDVVVKDIQDLSVVFGKNVSGRSNVLRALNLFFNNETHPGQEFDPELDVSVRIPEHLGSRTGHLGTRTGALGQGRERSDRVSGGLLGFGLKTSPFSARRAGEVDDVSVVYHRVADGVGDRGVAKSGVPLAGR